MGSPLDGSELLYYIIHMEAAHPATALKTLFHNCTGTAPVPVHIRSTSAPHLFHEIEPSATKWDKWNSLGQFSAKTTGRDRPALADRETSSTLNSYRTRGLSQISRRCRFIRTALHPSVSGTGRNLRGGVGEHPLRSQEAPTQTPPSILIQTTLDNPEPLCYGLPMTQPPLSTNRPQNSPGAPDDLSHRCRISVA